MVVSQLSNAQSRLWCMQVCVGVRDPNPLVNNAGVDNLLNPIIKKIKIGGQEEQDCLEINADFMARMAPS